MRPELRGFERNWRLHSKLTPYRHALKKISEKKKMKKKSACRWVECVGQVLYLATVAAYHYGNYVELHIAVEAKALDVGVGRRHRMLLLAPVNARLRLYQKACAARFDLNDMQRFVFLRHNVQLLVPPSPVGVANGKPVRQQVGRGGFLAAFPEVNSVHKRFVDGWCAAKLCIFSYRRSATSRYRNFFFTGTGLLPCPAGMQEQNTLAQVEW
jgi:hypothetical protein